MRLSYKMPLPEGIAEPKGGVLDLMMAGTKITMSYGDESWPMTIVEWSHEEGSSFVEVTLEGDVPDDLIGVVRT